MPHIRSLSSFFFVLFFLISSLPLFGWDFCGSWNSYYDSTWGVTADTRVAYYHPSSKKVRRIYGDGWTDYQIEFSKRFKGFGSLLGQRDCFGLNDLEWSMWTGVSGFSKKGESIGLDNHTKLQLIPINFGLKIFYPIFCNTKVFIGGAACYSLLRIHDHSEYVHKHTQKECWGALFQSGITYDFCDYVFMSAFFDYYFQRFHFHDSKYSSFSESSDYYGSRYIERSDLNMNGYKAGISVGFAF